MFVSTSDALQKRMLTRPAKSPLSFSRHSKVMNKGSELFFFLKIIQPDSSGPNKKNNKEVKKHAYPSLYNGIKARNRDAILFVYD